MRAKHHGGWWMVPLMAALGSDGADPQPEVRVTAKAEDPGRRLEVVKVAVELGADLNAANEAGDTALHTAASKGFDTVIQFLADTGAKLDVKNKRGHTPLAIATMVAGRPRGAPGVETRAAGNGQHTADLLRKLGAKD